MNSTQRSFSTRCRAGPVNNLRHCGSEVVIADLPCRHTAQGIERFDMAFQESLLPAGRVNAVDRFSRGGQAESEHVTPGAFPVGVDPELTEIDLGLRARGVFLRDEYLNRRVPGLDSDIGAAGLHILAHRGIRDHSFVLINQAVKDTLDGIALLPRSVQISQEHRINYDSELPQLRRRTGSNPSCWRFSSRQRLTCLPLLGKTLRWNQRWGGLN
ncbi:hypothetical protein ABIB27_003926 [Arthrobacter sp. UYEF21]